MLVTPLPNAIQRHSRLTIDTPSQLFSIFPFKPNQPVSNDSNDSAGPLGLRLDVIPISYIAHPEALVRGSARPTVVTKCVGDDPTPSCKFIIFSLPLTRQTSVDLFR